MAEAGVSRAVGVIVAEKNPLLQKSLEYLLTSDQRFRLIAMCADGEEFLTAIERNSPDVGIIGWEMPKLDGQGVLQALKGKAGAPRVIVYTGSPNPEVPRRAMVLAAAGFCSKRDQPENLLETILSVAAGRMVFPFIDIGSLADDPFALLTPRERELLAALSSGLTNQQMASKLDISLNTVKFHLKNLYDKLTVSNRAQAVAFYLKGQSGGVSHRT
jgi:two-component system nitrate/nitrite response regulator NarL